MAESDMVSCYRWKLISRLGASWITPVCFSLPASSLMFLKAMLTLHSHPLLSLWWILGQKAEISPIYPLNENLIQFSAGAYPGRHRLTETKTKLNWTSRMSLNCAGGSTWRTTSSQKGLSLDSNPGPSRGEVMLLATTRVGEDCSQLTLCWTAPKWSFKKVSTSKRF